MQQPSDQRGLAIIYAPRRRESQQFLAQVALEKTRKLFALFWFSR
jgi:hypothetical protein